MKLKQLLPKFEADHEQLGNPFATGVLKPSKYGTLATAPPAFTVIYTGVAVLLIKLLLQPITQVYQAVCDNVVVTKFAAFAPPMAVQGPDDVAVEYAHWYTMPVAVYGFCKLSVTLVPTQMLVAVARAVLAAGAPVQACAFTRAALNTIRKESKSFFMRLKFRLIVPLVNNANKINYHLFYLRSHGVIKKTTL